MQSKDDKKCNSLVSKRKQSAVKSQVRKKVRSRHQTWNIAPKEQHSDVTEKSS